MLSDAYYYGLTPLEVARLTVSEMADYIEAQRQRDLDLARMFSNIGYVSGMIGSMSLSTTRPKFDDVFNFDDKNRHKVSNVQKLEAEMLVWAENLNRQGRKLSK